MPTVANRNITQETTITTTTTAKKQQQHRMTSSVNSNETVYYTHTYIHTRAYERRLGFTISVSRCSEMPIRLLLLLLLLLLLYKTLIAVWTNLVIRIILVWLVSLLQTLIKHICARTWEKSTYHIDDQQRLWRDCAYAQSRQSLCCS